MKDALGITESAYSKLMLKLTPLEIFKYLDEYGQGQISLYYYADKVGGSFIKLKRNADLIANAIFTTLTAKEQISLYEYFEWLKRNPK